MHHHWREIMRPNEGSMDRALRIIVGLAILSQVFVGLQTPWAWIGVVPLVTGLVGVCPAYSLLGLNTCGVKRTPG
jgi:membrane-associated protease RseP (regulator of RpoE activity)